MASFSDYIVFVDESGDHGMASINEAFPLFVLACCLISKRDYMEIVVPTIQRIKFATFGHDGVVLHEREIRRDLGPFSMLRDRDRKLAFLEALTDALAATPMTIFAAVIDKRRLADRNRAENPYEMSLRFCLERIQYKLNRMGQTAGRPPDRHEPVASRSAQPRLGSHPAQAGLRFTRSIPGLRTQMLSLKNKRPRRKRRSQMPIENPRSGAESNTGPGWTNVGA